MDIKPLDVNYIGFVLPALFFLSLVFEGVYKIYKHEEGILLFILGLLFFMSLVLIFLNFYLK